MKRPKGMTHHQGNLLEVLSTGRLWPNLWYKAQNSPFDNSYSNIFSLFQLETKTQFLLTTGCPKIYDQNLHFWIFSKNSFRNELKAPFLLKFDTHDLTCKNFHFVLRGAPGGPRCQNLGPKPSFWIVSKNSFRNELKAPFLLYFDTHDLTCKNFHFVRRGAPGGPRTLKKIFMISKNYFN